MAETKEQEPRGLGVRNRGLAAEYAQEQGWGLDEEERTKLPKERQAINGGTDYDYGARDFGDEAVDTSGIEKKLEESVAKAFGVTPGGDAPEKE